MKELYPIHFNHRFGFVMSIEIILLTTLILLSTIATNSTSCIPFPPIQLDSLQDIYTSTNGRYWVYGESESTLTSVPWNFSQPFPDPCNQNWAGITCSGCYVNTLNLVNMNLSGTIPQSIGGFGSSLISLTISQNPLLHGTIPPTFYNFTNLVVLNLQANSLTGSFPSSISQKGMKSLQSIYLRSNMLTGSLPSTGWTSLPQLQNLYLAYNHFDGSIPIDWFHLKHIRVIDGSDNYFSGTITSNISTTCSLVELNLAYNMLYGSLTSNIVNLHNLEHLILYRNLLSGTLSSNLDKLTQLKYLMIDTNIFVGTIPTSLLNLQNLEYFYLFNNLFHGTLPAFGSKYGIGFFNIFNNYLTGTLPNNITAAGGMITFDIHANLFTGTLPAAFMKKNPYMRYIYIQNNNFTGTIPSLEALTSLQFARFDQNKFTGSLPSGISSSYLYRLQGNFNPATLQLVNFSYNYLHGKINQTDFQLAKGLEIIDIGKNYLSGTIGKAFALNPFLQRLLLQDNYFSGNIEGMVDFDLQRNLTSLDLSANELTGTIPDVYFTHSNLSVFLASTNCFHGSISDVMCTNTHLRILILDGLHTAEYCRTLIFPGLHKSFHKLNAYMLTTPIQGSIPPCLFSMPNMETLHLSGNALRGSLPNQLDISHSMKELSLSHNQLSGTIPSTLLQYPWEDFDLSFNRFAGTISSKISNFSSGHLKLEINRLSGLIPTKLHSAHDIDILQGNLFECPLGRSQLPVHDENIASYECGSNSVDSSLYASSGALMVVILLAALLIVSVKDVNFREWNSLTRGMYRIVRYIEVEVFLWWQIYNSKSSSLYFNQPIEHVYEFGAVMKEIRRWCIAIGVVIMTVLLPLYSLLSLGYSTYSYTYSWQLSIAYLSGRVPASLILVVMIIFLFGIFSAFFRNHWMNVFHLYQRSGRKMISQSSHHSKTNLAITTTITAAAPVLGDVNVKIERTYHGWYIAMIVGGLLNVVIVLIVNVSYVIGITGGKLQSDVQQTLSFAVTLYKIIWNGTLMEAFQSLLMKLMPLDKKNGELNVVSFMIWMNLFNNILAPCIAVAFVSPDCFYYAIYQAPKVKASFAFTECDGYLYSNLNDLYCEAEYSAAYLSTYVPPFTYNYECSSALLSNFADIIMYRFVISGFVTPLIYIIGKYCQEEAFVRYGQQSYPYSVAVALLPSALIPLSDDALQRRKDVREKERLQSVAEEDDEVHATGKQTKEGEGEEGKETKEEKPEEQEEGIFEVVFKAKNAVIEFISDIAVLLTFGGIFPPIAFVGVLSICVSTLVTQLILGRVIVLSRTQEALRPSVERINEKCGGIRILMIRSLLSLSLLLSMFWSFFLFDILGDSVGIARAIWIIGVMTAVPGTIQFTNYLARRYNISLVLSLDDNSNNNGGSVFQGMRDEDHNKIDEKHEDIELSAIGLKVDHGPDKTAESNSNSSEVVNILHSNS